MKPFLCVLCLAGTFGGCADPVYLAHKDAAAGPSCDGACAAAVLSADAATGVEASTALGDATAAPSKDAGASQAPSGSDGSVGSPPAGVELLLGRYGVRARSFSNDLPNKIFGFQYERLMLATIYTDSTDQSLKMTVEMCKDSWQILAADGTSQDAWVLFPQLWPKRSYDVHYENGAFFTSGGVMAVGYDPVPPAACTGAAQAPRREEQSWISGTECDCPQTSALPTKPGDCRLTDPDKDGRAGVTVQQTTSAGLVSGSTRTRDASQWQYGKVQPDGRHTAQYQVDEDYYVLSCEPTSPLCVNGDFASCPSALQPVLFEPLSARPDRATWSCTDLVTQYGAGNVFTNDVLKFPAACR